MPVQEKTIVRCKGLEGENCGNKAKGYDIIKTISSAGNPVWAVFYICPNGHEFTQEYERKEDG